MHGKTDYIEHNKSGIFADIASPMQVARYHSLVVDTLETKSPLEIIAKTSNTIMALAHKKHKNLFGVQFHPESFLSEKGPIIIKNFITKY